MNLQIRNTKYPFGMLIESRKHLAFGGDYAYGFNGKENDNEVKGEGNQQDYGMRIYDTRLCRFLSVDPLAKDYPWYTPYQFAGNTSIQAIDLDGLEEYVVTDYYNNLGVQVKTVITLVSSNGVDENQQIVHRRMVGLDANNNEVFSSYIGSSVGTTTGNNAFYTQNERETATGTTGGVSRVINLAAPLPMRTAGGGVVNAVQVTEKMQPVSNSGNPEDIKYNDVYYDAAGRSYTREGSGAQAQTIWNVPPIPKNQDNSTQQPDMSTVPEKGARTPDPSNPPAAIDLPQINQTDIE